jgi:hypothetical protein
MSDQESVWNALKQMAHLEARATAAEAENAKLRKALHHISLGSQNSSTTKEHLGREARTALETDNG